MALWRKLEADPLFHPAANTASPDDQKRRAALQLVRFHTLGTYTDEVANLRYGQKVR
jgi:hypothetical protein